MMDKSVNILTFFLTSNDDPDIANKSLTERWHKCLHTTADTPISSWMIMVVFGEVTTVLGGGCECHGAPHSHLSDDNVKIRTVKKFRANRGSNFSLANEVRNREITTKYHISFERSLQGLS